MGANEKHAATYHGAYTPNVDELRDAWVDNELNALPRAQAIELVPKVQAAFDGWLETVRAEAKAEALRDAADTLNPELINYRHDAMKVLSQPIRPAGGDSTMSLQLALLAANRTAAWLRARANQYKEEQ